MNKKIRNVFKIKCIFFHIVSTIVSKIPRNKRVILFSSWFGREYSDSPMFLYEYFEKLSAYKVYWYTNNKKLYVKLKNAGKGVVYRYSLKSIFLHLRANVFVSSLHFADFHPVLMGGGNLYDLDHGIPNKFVFFKEDTLSDEWRAYQYLIRKYVKVYLLATNRRLMEVYRDCYDIPENNIALGNKPRTDALFNQSLRKGRNEYIDKLKNGCKAIVYMPTHRSAGKRQLNCHQLLDLDALQKMCEETDSVFFIKKHFFHSQEQEDYTKYSRIFDITNVPNLDSEVLLYQTDILISDYSSVYIDFLLLNRPIVLYVFDEEDFVQNERDMYIKLSENDVGHKVKEKTELISVLKTLTRDWEDKVHESGRESLKFQYFDKGLKDGHACSDSEQIINLISNNQFFIDWTKYQKTEEIE